MGNKEWYTCKGHPFFVADKCDAAVGVALGQWNKTFLVPVRLSLCHLCSDLTLDLKGLSGTNTLAYYENP
jgi:hypothetical protein